MIVMDEASFWLLAFGFWPLALSSRLSSFKLKAKSQKLRAASLPPEVLRIPLGVLFPLFRQIVEREDG